MVTFCTYYIAWIFQWILGDEGRGEWWLQQVHRADRQHRVWNPTVCCVLDVTYVRGSFCWLLAPGLQFLSGGGRHPGTGLTCRTQRKIILKKVCNQAVKLWKCAPELLCFSLSSEYLSFCSAEQIHSYRFGTTWGWVNNFELSLWVTQNYRKGNFFTVTALYERWTFFSLVLLLCAVLLVTVLFLFQKAAINNALISKECLCHFMLWN